MKDLFFYKIKKEILISKSMFSNKIRLIYSFDAMVLFTCTPACNNILKDVTYLFRGFVLH